ncbi:S8 family peptidase [Calothrix sp. NIES-3974]|uniref:S8 family peptidase n=1 Tax=Calothrix sp. NIES-3974 TaxID=2005462 RepID=UPI000B5E95D1|nr:S8 family serine peptidase [Calothrix sp. NIES-3974]BAZ07963.1 protease [Calothrix sp. NIES-3974]
MHSLEPETTPNSPSCRFEGFFLQMVRPGLATRCEDIIRKILGTDWQIKPIGDSTTKFEITKGDDALSVKQAWDKTYELRSQPGIIDAEPLFAVPVPERRDWDTGLKPDFAIFNNQIAAESSDVTWGLQQIRVLDAWQKYFPDPHHPPGHGIIIAHPDTGYTEHPEIIPNLLLEQSFNFLRPNQKPLDNLETSGGEIINNPGHGTSTASLAISPPGPQATYPNGKYIVGVAPGAKLLPLRVTYSVVLLSVRNLAEAIEYATDQGCHIITISLGTAFANQRLRSAILYAQKRGVIIVAAAGTMVPYVVYPAAYDEVIAVTSSNIRREVWWGASRGRQVDVTAPGESLWHAKTRKNASGEFTFNIEQDSGTSFSAPIVAGVAALWLSYHGRDNLIARYGEEKIPFIFNQLLRDSCEKFPTWRPNRFGAGIVNTEKLLAAPLPDYVHQAVRPPAFALQQHTPIDSGEWETFMHLFESVMVDSPTPEKTSIDGSKLRVILAELLEVPETDLEAKLKQVGQELAFHLITNPDLYHQLIAVLRDDCQSGTENIPKSQFKTTLPSQNNNHNQLSLGKLLREQDISHVLAGK